MYYIIFEMFETRGIYTFCLTLGELLFLTNDIILPKTIFLIDLDRNYLLKNIFFFMVYISTYALFYILNKCTRNIRNNF